MMGLKLDPQEPVRDPHVYSSEWALRQYQHDQHFANLLDAWIAKMDADPTKGDGHTPRQWLADFAKFARERPKA